MFEIIITENTYSFLLNYNLSMHLIHISKIKIRGKDREYIMTFELNADNVDYIYQLILLIYDNKPDENNRWIFAEKEYLISDETFIRDFLYDFEGTDNYPLRRNILSDVIQNEKINNVQQVRELAQKPFTGLLFFNQFDIFRLLGVLSNGEFSQCIKTEHQNVLISNRYITNAFEISKGNVCFRNCILDGDIVISGDSDVHFSQCIITGKITCFGVSRVYLSSVNVKQFFLYNSCLDLLHFEYSKIYRFIFHSSTVKRFELHSNKFIESYISNLDLPDSKIKIDMSQFNIKNINERTIKKINKDSQIKIKNEDAFYLTFLFRNQVNPILSKDIALDMIDIILTYGNLDKEHHLYSDMKYKKALYSNMKWSRAFVRLTGAFYIPSRWIIYLALSTVLFTVLYISIPMIQFINISTSMIERLDFWTALYYSLCQIIGSNPTNFSPIGIAQILTTIQSIVNTVFVANFFASLIKKFMRDEI